jgi:hypothetical protein
MNNEIARIAANLVRDLKVARGVPFTASIRDTIRRRDKNLVAVMPETTPVTGSTGFERRDANAGVANVASARDLVKRVLKTKLGEVPNTMDIDLAMGALERGIQLVKSTKRGGKTTIGRDREWLEEYERGLDDKRWVTEQQYAEKKNVPRDTMQKALKRARESLGK